MMKNKFGLRSLIFVFVLFAILIEIQSVSADLNLQITASSGDLSTRFVALTDSSATTGYDEGYDAVFKAPPGNYSKLYSSVGGNELVIDSWNSTTTTRTIILKYETVPIGNLSVPQNIVVSWSFSDKTNYDASLTFCRNDSSCSFSEDAGNMESGSSKTFVSLDLATPQYFILTVTYNPPQPQTNTTTTTTGGGGGGGVNAQRTSLKIDLPRPLALEEPGPVEFNITLENDGDVALKDVSLLGSITQNSKELKTPVTFDKNSFIILEKGKKETIKVKTRIDTEEISVYEIIINASSKEPSYKTQAKIYLTFIGKDGRGIVKIVAFTEGLINENAPCLELKPMIEDAKKELEKGNAKEGLEKAQQALEACKKLVEGPKKPIFSFFDQNRLAIYLAIAIILSILFGIFFNLYKMWRFRKARFFKAEKHK